MPTYPPQHKIIPAEGYVTVKLNGELMPDTADLFHNDLQGLLDLNVPVIIQCVSLSGMAHQWIRPLVTLVREASRYNLQVRFVQVSFKVEQYFKSQGVDSMFKTCPTLREALAGMGLASKKVIDTDFINPFLAATIKVLEVQTNTKAAPGKIYVKGAGDKFTGDISAVIGLVSETFTGTVVVSFPAPTFLEIMARLLSEKHTTITKELEDGAGELINIIFGQAKIILNEKGYGIQTA
ncbi:MAG: chemotaxis protein CheX, partial [Bdellovibrionota bacterium]